MGGFTGGGEALALTKLLQYISSIKADCMARQQANDAQLSTMVAEQDVEGMTVMSISVEAGAPRESLSDDKKIVDIQDSLVQSDYHLSSEVKHQNFFISEMRRLIKETQYTLLLYIQASHTSDWTDNKGNKEANLSVENSRRRYIDGEHWFDVEGSQDYGKTEVKYCPDDFGRDENLDLDESEYDADEYGEFADEIGDGLILGVKVMRCILIKKSSLEKLLMCKKSIMMFSMIDAKRAVKELRTQW
ncbi:unnamed protein product [Brassica napus]|uniref:(rape) hypothetical protein n=1 Tax=Brassica napus TaxID=3708 RepID=A0A816RMI3_BRANA|nr:unnamed protein product [Brassica napus]